MAAAGCAWRKQAQIKREAAYRSALLSYSEALKLETTRKNAEGYLTSKGTEFRQMCCIEKRSVLSDLVWIGKEHHPWYCEQHNVYIALQFDAVEPHRLFQASDSDVLKKISVFHWLEGCL